MTRRDEASRNAAQLPPRARPRRAYGRYTGGDPLAPPVEVQSALEAIGQDVMAGTSADRALREYLRRGDSDREGLDDLARRVRERRADLVRRHRLDGTLDEVRKLLDRAVLEERKHLVRDVHLDDDARAFAEMRLENLPASTAAAVNDLADYDWQSPSARADYDRIRELLGRELLDQRFAGMKNALESATDADRQAIRDMLNDLNDLLEKRRLGDDTQEDFDEFMRDARGPVPRGPAESRRAPRHARRALRGRAADAQLHDPRAAGRAPEPRRAGFRLARPHAVAVTTRRQPALAPAGRGLDGFGILLRR